MREQRFFIDPIRCIGCKACMQACSECNTHRGKSMIHLEQVDRSSTQTAPMICMHCDHPTCAAVCPADAIKRSEDQIVHSSDAPRCIGCSNCVMACPFGVPRYYPEIDQMLKCDMCYDRSSVGLKPMCATVCPSEALYYGPLEEFQSRRHGSVVDTFFFGNHTVRTLVAILMPKGQTYLDMDVVSHMDARFDNEAFDHIELLDLLDNPAELTVAVSAEEK